MAAFKIVQEVNSLILPLSGVQTSNPISLKSGYLRIRAESDCYLEVGYTPVGINTISSLWIDRAETLVLKENIASQRVVGVITGTNTLIDFPQGTGSPVEVNDYVSLSGIQPVGINTNYARVSNIYTSSGVGGYYSTRIALDWNTSSVTGVITATDSAEIRKAVKVSALDGGFGPNKVHITEIQITSEA
jgi:hypothetical protein